MTALGLVMLPVLAYAAFRAAIARGLAARWSVVVGIVVAAGLTVPPVVLFRTAPPRQASAARPGTAETLEVIFGDGWQPAVRDERQRLVRSMAGEAQVVVGQLVATRPSAEVAVRLEALRRPRRVTVSFDATVLASRVVSTGGTVVRIRVPPGEGPAVLRFIAEPSADGPTVAALAESLTVAEIVPS